MTSSEKKLKLKLDKKISLVKFRAETKENVMNKYTVTISEQDVL